MISNPNTVIHRYKKRYDVQRICQLILSNLNLNQPFIIPATVKPPSGLITCPIVKLQAGEERNATTSAISSGRPNQRNGIRITTLGQASYYCMLNTICTSCNNCRPFIILHIQTSSI